MTTEEQREPMSIRLSPRERATAQAIAHMSFQQGVGNGLRSALESARCGLMWGDPNTKKTFQELESRFLAEALRDQS